MKGILFGVGVGPGDPALLTLKAVEIIRSAPVLAVPDAGGEKTALQIVENYTAGKEILPCPMPMTRDLGLLRQSREKSAGLICERLEKGENVAFLTLGDPSVYSTYTALHRLVTARGFEARAVPGVPSFCAAAAALGVPLCEGGGALHVFPASYGGLSEGLALKGAKVLMKSGKKLSRVKEELRARGLLGRARMVERCGMEGERIVADMERAGDDAGYFSIILVEDGETR